MAENKYMTRKPSSLVFAILILPLLAQSAELSVTARQEIDLLLDRLGSSSCEFYRNGTWHSAANAHDHLNRKLAYLLDKHRVSSAEEFIEIGASKSSVSGKPYLVRCNKQPEIPSAFWLRRELDSIRVNAAAQTARKN